jgi:hypothetical protein
VRRPRSPEGHGWPRQAGLRNEHVRCVRPASAEPPGDPRRHQRNARTLEPLTRLRVSRVAPPAGWLQGGATAPCSGRARQGASTPSAVRRNGPRRNPQGRASFVARLCRSGLAHQSPCAAPLLLGLRRDPLRRDHGGSCQRLLWGGAHRDRAASRAEWPCALRPCTVSARCLQGCALPDRLVKHVRANDQTGPPPGGCA